MSLRARRRAFTFIELAFVTGLVAVISLASYKALSNGLSLRKRVAAADPLEDVAVMTEHFVHDVRNALVCTRPAPAGTAQYVALPAMVASPRMQVSAPGEAAYYYDETKHALRREVRDYSQVSMHEDGTVTGTLEGIRRCEFSYWSFDPATGKYAWTKELSRAALPAAVRIEMDVDDATAPEGFVRMVRTVAVPVGS